jgi:serine/threonine-protein kinase HipA
VTARARRRLTRSARPRLAVLLDGSQVGRVYRSANSRLTFVYDDAWRERRDAYPLSLSMPLTAAEHGHRVTASYLWGLLPDNPDVLEAWAHEYRISRTNVIDLLEHVGEDVAGAAQFCRLERVDDLLGHARLADTGGAVEWLTEREIGAALRQLRERPGGGRAHANSGQFSLAGQQPKLALYRAPSGRWGIPSGRVPTNHILKPPALPYPDFEWNEMLCLRVAASVGLAAAPASIMEFGGEPALVVSRYDRAEIRAGLARIHQEDFCQALGIPPTRRYESRGGPSIVQSIELLRGFAADGPRDVSRFLDAVAFNWLVGGTDAHGKNYSLLHGPGGSVLAPLYDLISVLPYPTITRDLAMSIGGERRLSVIGSRHWRALARALNYPDEGLLKRIGVLADLIPAAVERVLEEHRGAPRFADLARMGLVVAEHAQLRGRSLLRA